jgi:hypothetical protein
MIQRTAIFHQRLVHFSRLACVWCPVGPSFDLLDAEEATALEAAAAADTAADAYAAFVDTMGAASVHPLATVLNQRPTVEQVVWERAKEQDSCA